MEKFVKLTQGKRFLSLILAVVMMATVFNMALPMLKLDASAANSFTLSDGTVITQTPVVGTDGSYEKIYANYAGQYLNRNTEPTEIVIPGLSNSEDYTVQGMAYYAQKDWIMISAYYGDSDEKGVKKPSLIYALDAVTGDFVACFEIYNKNSDGSITPNYDHGGGIAFSEHNFYYSGDDTDLDEGDTKTDARVVSYAPLSQFDVEGGCHKIILEAEVDFYELGNASTAYVCYDQGVLWLGNFYAEDVNVLGLTVSDSKYDGKANDSYSSMVYGYELQGSSSEEEWANLLGATGEDCQGNPSHVLCLDSSIYNVQYAIVDNGKLYLSRSWGVGETEGTWGNISQGVAGLADTSTLSVFDIDLSTHGTTSVTFNTDGSGGTRTVTDAYLMASPTNFELMPMSEGICAINDYLFMNFESATYKYRVKGDGNLGVCQSPIDVVWKIDQYALMGEEREREEKTISYEKVSSLSEITNDGDYIILYESAEKYPVTNKNILYALTSDGGFKDYKLSKRSASDSDAYAGYNGMVGREIKDYDIDSGNGKEKLYLYNEEDDCPEVRWSLSVSGDTVQIRSRDTYFANYRNLHFNSAVIGMAADGVSDLSNIKITQATEGRFYLSYNNTYYLWCNDGTIPEYNTAINTWYTNHSSTTMYNGLTETKGTFHTDAMNKAAPNIIGGEVKNYEHGMFHIYKRVIDDYASTAESRVFTDMSAELQEDGTYTVKLETYATSPTQYQTLERQRATDFIFVLDASASMTSESYKATGYDIFEADVGFDFEAAAGTSDVSGVTGCDANGDKKEYKGNMYIRHSDGELCQIGVVAQKDGKSGTTHYQRAYLFYDHPDGTRYWYHPNTQQWTTTETTYDEAQRLGAANQEDRRNTNVFKGVRTYQYKQNSEGIRFDTMKTAVEDLTYNIAEHADANNLAHRIAVVQYGSDSNESWLNTGMYVTGKDAMEQYSGDNISETVYKAAFHDVSNFGKVRNNVMSMSITGDSDTYSNYGFDMARKIAQNSGANYYADGERSLAVIMITDGVPGNSKDDTNEAYRVSDLAIEEARKLKEIGAYVYTIQLGNNSVSGFDMDRYLDYTSSEYIYAKSMAKAGERNLKDIAYHLDISESDGNAFKTFVDGIFSSVQSNSTSGLAKLDADSILREQLTEAFVIPEGKYDYKVEFAPGYYDKVGRFAFDEPSDKIAGVSDVKVNTVKDSKGTSVHITGYDYSAQCIQRYKETKGNKLIVTLTGLLANPDAKITNTSINNTQTTAIYQDQDWINKDYAFKFFPTEYFNIPEYTYVLDYGLQMLDTEVNGTLKSVSADLSAQRDASGNLAYKTISENGLVEIQDGAENLLYHNTPTNNSDSGFVLIQRDNGKYDWFEIKVVPASNVYYEENEVKDPEGSTVGNIEWASVGTTDGIYRNLPGEGDIYGYDEYYDNTNPHSNNSYLKVNISNKKGETTSKKKTFQFTGTGFDLVSACGPNTGVLTLVVKDSDGNRVKSFMVDTYYKDTEVTDNKDTEVTETLLSQVPVVKWSTDKHDTYTVEVAALFVSGSGAVVNGHSSTVKNNLIDTGLVMNSAKPENTSDIEEILENAGLDEFITDDMELVWFDDNSVLNGGTGVEPTKKTKGLGDTNDRIELEAYIDGFRVYNPLGTDASAYANYSDSEKNVTYANVIDNLARVDSSGNAIDELFGIGYLTGLGEDVTNVTFADYQKLGPKGELYLKAGSAITFKINRAEAAEKVMLGLRAVNGPATAQVNKVAIESGITSATEMYYDITNCVGEGDNVLVTVTNTGSTLLAINHIKFSGGSTKNTTVSNNAVRSSTRTGDVAQVSESIFLPVTQADLVEIEEIMSGETIPATVKNGVVVPLVENDETVNPDDTTTPDVPEDDNTNGDTDTDNSETEDFSIFSLLELLISILEKILHNAFGTGNIA